MAQILVRKIDDKVMNAVKKRAKAHKRSTEAEARAILEEAARPTPKHERRSLMSLVGSAPSNRTTEEIVADMRALRDEWE